MSVNLKDAEVGKFTDKNEVKVFTGGDLLCGIHFDEIRVVYPIASVEEYNYYLDLVLKASITITYQDASKAVLISAKRVL